MRGREHRKRSREKFGNDYRNVHDWVDKPSKWLGPKHRQERHRYRDVITTLRKKDLGHARAHLQHIRDDKSDSRRKKKGSRIRNKRC